jgi:hypothetical protein
LSSGGNMFWSFSDATTNRFLVFQESYKTYIFGNCLFLG